MTFLVCFSVTNTLVFFQYFFFTFVPDAQILHLFSPFLVLIEIFFGYFTFLFLLVRRHVSPKYSPRKILLRNLVHYELLLLTKVFLTLTLSSFLVRHEECWSAILVNCSDKYCILTTRYHHHPVVLLSDVLCYFGSTYRLFLNLGCFFVLILIFMDSE